MKTNVGSMGQNGTAELDQMEKAVMHKEEKMMRECREAEGNGGEGVREKE